MNFSGRFAVKLWCVNSRWNPTLMPKPATRYRTAASTRSCRLTALPQSSGSAIASATAGPATNSEVTTRSVTTLLLAGPSLGLDQRVTVRFRNWCGPDVATLPHATQARLGVLRTADALDGSEIAAIARLASGGHHSTLRAAAPAWRRTGARWEHRWWCGEEVGSPSEPSSGRGEATRDRTGRESPRRKSPGTPLARSHRRRRRTERERARERDHRDDRRADARTKGLQALLQATKRPLWSSPASGVQGRCFTSPRTMARMPDLARCDCAVRAVRRVQRAASL